MHIPLNSPNSLVLPFLRLMLPSHDHFWLYSQANYIWNIHLSVYISLVTKHMNERIRDE
jgi:hypothetical protein